MSASPFVSRSSWVWSAEGSHAVPSPDAASPSHYQVRRFRRCFKAQAGARLVVHVSADSRYVLYCNGQRVARGPAKGDVNHHFYETVDVSAHLVEGRNVLAALVLDMSRVAHRPALLGAPCSVMTYTGGWLLEGALTDAAGVEGERLDTGAPGWRVAVDQGLRFQNEGTTFEGYHGYFEHRVDREIPTRWAYPDFEDGAWPEAVALYRAERRENRRDPASPYGLVPRMIPALEEGAEAGFAEVFAPGGGDAGDGWRAVVAGRGRVEVPRGATVEVILDTGRLTTAYPGLRVRGGAGARIRVTYAEALRLPWETEGARLLGRKQSLENLASHFADESTGWTFDRRGRISGWSDLWEPAGGAETQEWEPWHWRAFRYVGLTLTAGDEPLVIEAVAHRFTAYPYVVAAEFRCSDPRLERIWTTALHTMRLCSHETFEDCPHYEQMQYAGDTMITSKIALLASGDARLSRQALYHFDWSRLPDGLTQSRFPSRLVQVIPSWSLHWITTVRDTYYFTGEQELVRDLLPGVRAVLDWFRRHADADGLPARLPYWNITDWCPWWPRGVVPGADTGPTCIISAQYIVALDEVADLCRRVGREREAIDLTAEAANLRRALHARFWSEEEGLYFDRPGGPEVSQYGNAWAVVCGAAGPAQWARLKQRFPHDAKLAPGSFFCWHAVFKALDLMGVHDRMPEFLGPWHESVEAGLSCFVEENSYWRSLCHAWSAHPALEFMQRVLGVTPREPGFVEIDVRPSRCGLTRAEGRVCTPRGPVTVRWRVEGRQWLVDVEAPARTPVNLHAPDGTVRRLEGGRGREIFTLSA